MQMHVAVAVDEALLHLHRNDINASLGSYLKEAHAKLERPPFGMKWQYATVERGGWAVRSGYEREYIFTFITVPDPLARRRRVKQSRRRWAAYQR